ncbi:hypothetical protein, partial [uncultured Desulfovibrio sp.]|uniref:hypothetical protein n=1 Tax=uncultured Desulfovibrio sp. TaxID=167968 RepID=UPI0028060831
SVFAMKLRNALAAARADARAVIRRKTMLFRRNAGSETDENICKTDIFINKMLQEGGNPCPR